MYIVIEKGIVSIVNCVLDVPSNSDAVLYLGTENGCLKASVKKNKYGTAQKDLPLASLFDVVATLQRESAREVEAMTAKAPHKEANSANVVQSITIEIGGLTFRHVSSERQRTYLMANGLEYTVQQPRWLHVNERDNHRLVDNAGRSHYVPRAANGRDGWVSFWFEVKDGLEPWSF